MSDADVLALLLSTGEEADYAVALDLCEERALVLDNEHVPWSPHQLQPFELARRSRWEDNHAWHRSFMTNNPPSAVTSGWTHSRYQFDVVSKAPVVGCLSSYSLDDRFFDRHLHASRTWHGEVITVTIN